MSGIILHRGFKSLRHVCASQNIKCEICQITLARRRGAKDCFVVMACFDFGVECLLWKKRILGSANSDL